MVCCCSPEARSTGRVFSRMARFYRKRFERRGFEPSQRLLLEGLSRQGFRGMSILEVGCGVGHFHQTLLEQGAGTAVGMDLAERMIEEARAWARQRGLDQRTEYRVGDFVASAQELAPADLVLLDKVVCCYPDADAMVHQSALRARKLYALIYPRDRWYVRLGVRLGAWGMRLLGSCYRPYLHDPVTIHGWLEQSGLKRRHQARTWLWLCEIYERDAAVGAEA